MGHTSKMPSRERCNSLPMKNAYETPMAVSCEQPLSLVAAATLCSGLTESLEILRAPALVLRSTAPFEAGHV